jgi:superoxide dismutase, Fe-Mn family
VSEDSIDERREKMPCTAKDYNKRLGMEGFSENLLKKHFTVYQGYVRRGSWEIR